MPIIKATLSYKNETSDKIYQVEIVYLSWGSYQVNFAYGKTGKKLRSGTKTDKPVTLHKAEKIFDDLVKSKKNRGYQISNYQSLYCKEIITNIFTV